MATTWIEHHERGETVALVASTNEHVDAINRAVQAARLNAGHLDPDIVAPIAGGEHVHVGDVVATRRNDRTLITSAGEPVRNRETWTVTAIGSDGSLTVTREHGHGTVTLPADYAHEHVRLGYAATEHGYQSDTVDHAIALATSATTRRGLYVAATRGRDENLLCVVTDSDDVAEARDVLEGILALDRADIPAVTQRRTLAHQVHGHEPTPVPRCAIPEWFAPMLAQARADLAAAQARHADDEDELERLHAAAGSAEQRSGEVGCATADDRDALDFAIRRVDRARGDLFDATHRVATAPRRHRHHARSEVAIAERRVEHAEDYLERTRQRTSAAIASYTQAVAERDRLRADLRHHTANVPLSADQVRRPERRVDALETWRRWANGQPVTVERLREVVATLAADRSPYQAHSRALDGTIDRWASSHDIDLRPRQRIGLDRSRVGPDLGL